MVWQEVQPLKAMRVCMVMTALPPLLQTGASAAIERHTRHVQHIIQNSMLLHASSLAGKASGMFTCVAVTQKGQVYSGCAGELSCSCSFDGICKHLEAACSQQQFTHSMRSHAASQILQDGALIAIDQQHGICTFR